MQAENPKNKNTKFFVESVHTTYHGACIHESRLHGLPKGELLRCNDERWYINNKVGLDGKFDNSVGTYIINKSLKGKIGSNENILKKEKVKDKGLEALKKLNSKFKVDREIMELLPSGRLKFKYLKLLKLRAVK